MVSTVDFASPSGMSRSNSTPDLASSSSYRYGGSAGQGATYKPSDKRVDEFSFDNGFSLDTNFHRNGPTRSFPVTQTAEWRPFESKVELEQPPPQAPRRSRTGSLIDSTRLRFPGSKSSKELPQSRPETPNEDASSNANSGSAQRTKSRTDSFTSFAKRSWLSSSSSSSSSSNVSAKDSSVKESSVKPVISRRPELTANPQPTANRWSEPIKSAPRSFTRATSYFSKMKQKQPITEKPIESDCGSQSSAASDGPATASTGAVFSPQSTSYDSNFTPTTENSFSDLTTVQAQDPLWPTFKSIEMEFKVFISKTTSQQVVMVKTTVLPFLRNTANHWSTKKLHPDDLDRRTQVLNTWWTEILDMLDGTSVPGVDRPVLYEALTSIMMRSEWRLTTPYFMSARDRDSRETLRSNTWGKNLAPSANPDKPTTLVEAAERNVRATFVSNLVKQVVFIVEKMSLRYAPMPLVTFAGKTCAYAFFFIPGFAEHLARQWGVSQHQLKRTAEDLGISSLPNARPNDACSLFPPHLLSLRWTTPKTMYTLLRQESQTPSSMPGLSWSGHWKPRWMGLDTDLFFVFCKYFHVLSNDFLPTNATLGEKAQSPAFVLIQAQLLLNIDKTLHRQSAEAAANALPTLPPQPKGASLLSQVSGPDTTAMGMSLPVSEMGDLPKGMSDSKVIVLLRGVLFDSSQEQEDARRTFAEVFTRLAASAARKTSLYDSHACFTLCDFLEECLIIYDEFAGPEGPREYIDWAFWLDVLKKMLLSLNTVTEVRVLCFIFAVWDIIAKDPKRKAALCVDWLLTEEIFDAFYNHWCPLVRGYYHRLLCWRICRCDGNATEEDISIYRLAASRLETTWAHYLYMKQLAEQNGRFPPSTAAMVPTPGKKFMIIRQEAGLPLIGPYRILDSSPGPVGAGLAHADELAASTNQHANSKRKKSLLGKVIAFSAGVGNNPVPIPDDGFLSKSPARNPSWDEEFMKIRRETAESRTRSPSVGSDVDAASGNGADAVGSSAGPREPTNPFRFILALSEPVGPPQERILSVPRLPVPAQSVAKPRDQGPTLLRAVTSMAAPDRPPPPPPPKDNLVRAESQDFHMMTSSTWPLRSDVAEIDMTRSRQDSVASRFESPASSFDKAREPTVEGSVQPLKPTGKFARNAVYSGRSMAEWAQVVNECNNFSERRRHEGVLTLKGIEVPALSVDGFQGMSG